jgi:hypothetical protein
MNLNPNTKYIILHFEDWNSKDGPSIYEFTNKEEADSTYLEMTKHQKHINDQIVYAIINSISYLKLCEVINKP